MSKRSIVSMPPLPVKNKGSADLFGKRFQLAVLFCLAWSMAAGDVVWAQAVTLQTKDSVYQRSGAVALVLFNGMNEDIFSSAAGSDTDLAVVNFEKRKNQWVWDAFPVRCPRLECPGAKLPAGSGLSILAPGEQAVFSWKPRIYKDKALRMAEPGTYRVTVIYQKRVPADPKRVIWATVKSNEFNLE